MDVTTVRAQKQSHVAEKPAASSLIRRLRRIPLYRGQIALHAILILVTLAAVLPLVWAVFASFKHFKELVSTSDLLPRIWTLDSYRAVFGLSAIWSGFRNTLIVSTTVTVVSVFTSALEGYVFAKFEFPGKNILFLVLLSTMMIPFVVIMIPLFLIISGFGMNNHLSGVIVPGLFSTFGIFMLRQFMFGVPSEMLESARIDGASEWRIFFQMIIPLSLSPMAALGIFVFLGSWNDFLWPSIVLTTQDTQTLTIVVNGLLGLFWTNYDYMIAAAVLTLLPLMVVYLFASRYMIAGIAMTGLKV